MSPLTLESKAPCARSYTCTCVVRVLGTENHTAFLTQLYIDFIMAKKTQKTKYSLTEVLEEVTGYDSDLSDNVSDANTDFSDFDSEAEEFFLEGKVITLDK